MTGIGSSKIAVGVPLRTASMKLSSCWRIQRRGLHGQQHVDLFLNRTAGIDLHDLVLLLQLFDDQLLRSLRHPLHVEAAEQLRIGVDDSQSLSLRLRRPCVIDRTSSYSTGIP